MNKKDIFRIGVALLVGIIVFMVPVGVKAAEDDQTRVVIERYFLTNDGITPGGTSDLTLVLKNMNSSNAAYSIQVTCEFEADSTGTINPAYGTSNQEYIEELDAEEEKEITITLDADAALETDSLVCVVGIVYEDSTGSNASESRITIPVVRDGLDIQSVYYPPSAVRNSPSRISVSYENTTEEAIYNAILTVTGSNGEKESASIGTVLSGSVRSQEVYINFADTGTQTITATLTYEDSDGNSYEKTSDSYELNVSNTSAQTLDSTTDTMLYVKYGAYGLGLIVCVYILGLKIVRNKKNN